MGMFSNFLENKEQDSSFPASYWPPIDTLYKYDVFLKQGQPSSFKSGEPFAYGGRKGILAIIGAGVAGLVSAYETARANSQLQVLLFEASRRIGGRAYSYHWEEPGDVLLELGAMRFPLTPLFQYYANIAGLTETTRFPDPGKTPYTEITYRNKTLPWYEGCPAPPPFAKLQKKWERISETFIDLLKNRQDNPQVATRNWQQLIHTYWNKSFYHMLSSAGFNAKELSIFGALGIGSGGFGALYPISALDIIRIVVNGYEHNQKLYIQGISKLTDWLFNELQKLPNVQILNKAVTALEQTPQGHILVRSQPAPDNPNAHLEAGIKSKSKNYTYNFSKTKADVFQADALIVAMSNRAAHRLNIEKFFSSKGKSYCDIGIRNTHNVASTKIGCWTNTKFYKDSTSIPQCILSDSYLTSLYCLDYTPHSNNGHGLVFLSYTWDDSAEQLQGIFNETCLHSKPPIASVIDRLLLELKNSVPQFYQPFVKNIQTASGKIDYDRFCYIQWLNQPYYYGAFKLCYPGQDKPNADLYFDFLKTDNFSPKNIFVAGDAFSLSGGWLTSTLETAVNVSCAALKFFGATVRCNSPLSIKKRFEYWPKPTKPSASP